jgi:hypothetical protein
MRTDIHASSGIRTHDPSVRASEGVSCLDRAATVIGYVNYRTYNFQTINPGCFYTRHKFTNNMSTIVKPFVKVTIERVAFLFRVWKDLSSNLGSDTGHPEA